MEHAQRDTPKVKICCISSVDEALLALRYGASVLGLVGRMPSGPGVIDDRKIREIVLALPVPCETYLLTCEVEASGIIEHHRRTGTSAIQLVDWVSPEVYPKLRRDLPGVKLVQVVRVEDESSVDLAIQVAPLVDALLLDSGKPNAPTPELGGTGRTHNWEWSRRIVQSVPKPVFLAGGLRAQNIQEAIKKVRPYGIDLCSGVRTSDRLDENKLSAFMRGLE